jgi:ribosome biogenesis GTPase / thiamine phosphate phosphatase
MTEQFAALERYGWSEVLARRLLEYNEDLTPARVVSVHEGLSEVVTAEGRELVWNSIPPARLRPVTGDWVGLGQKLFERSQPKQTTARRRPRPEGTSPPDRRRRGIATVLPRASMLHRRLARAGDAEAAIAANVDLVLVVGSLTTRLRMEALVRYLAVAARGGIPARVVLTKCDLRRPAPEELEAMTRILGLHEGPHVVSAITGEGLESLDDHVRRRATSTLLGPSGAGKSTLVNRIFGQVLQRIADVSRSGAGRHTTTASHLYLAERGALYVDTPGVHRVGDPSTQDLEELFGDIRGLSSGCRYPSCGHRTEPDCAVLPGVDPARLALYLSLRSRAS